MTAGWGGRVVRQEQTHRCPGCRDVDVPNRLFCCTSCWIKLSAPVQQEIYRTARNGIKLQERSLAVQAARKEWNDAPKPPVPRV